MLLSTLSSSWLFVLLTSFAASIGGVFVFYGLWLEKQAEEEVFPDVWVDKAKSRKLKVIRGWRILMTGIGVEILAAIILNVVSVLELTQVIPINRPVSTISATVLLRIKGDGKMHQSITN
jgi:hypothetical protein